MKRTAFLISVIVLILVPAAKKPLAIQSPSGQIYYAYPSDATPNKNEDPALCRPFVGQVSDGKLVLSVSLPSFTPNVDVYLGVWSEALGAESIYMIIQGDQVILYPNGFKPWKSNTPGNLDESVFGTQIPLAALPNGTYQLYTAVTPTGSGNLNSYYLWSTYFSIVGPEGGTVKFPNGVILDIPSGAFPEKTNISAETLPCEQVDEILSAPNYSSHKKRCLDGLSIKMGMAPVKGPIVASIPVAEIDSSEIPVQISVDMEKKKYQLAQTDLVYRKTDGILQMSLHPSGQLIVNTSAKRTSETPKFEADYWNAVLENLIDESCRDCFLSSLPEWKGACSSWARYSGQPSCCMIPSRDRADCPTAKDCFCCKEKRNIVRASNVDFSSGDCQLLAVDVEVAYPDCPDAPVETDTLSEASAGCPDGMTFRIDVEPSPVNLDVCEKQKLKAKITGTKADGTVLFKDAPLFPTWKSIDTKFAVIRHDGTVEGISNGSTTIQALLAGNKEIPPGEARVEVSGNIGLFEVTPAFETIKVGEEIMLSAEVLDEHGAPLDANKVEWSTSDSTVADVVLPTGQLTSVIGKSSGIAPIKIDAAYKECKSSAFICVRNPVKRLVIRRSPIRFCHAPGSWTVLADAYDEDDNLIQCPLSLTWLSDNTRIAKIDSTSGVLTALRSGKTSIRAVTEDGVEATANVYVVDIEGSWSVTVVIDDCGEIYTYNGTLKIRQSGSSLTLETPMGTLYGTRTSCYTFSFSGGGAVTYGEEYGSGTGEISSDGRHISGVFYWTFDGIDEDTGYPLSCSGSSTFKGSR